MTVNFENRDNRDSGLGKFLLISLVLHAILIAAYPEWNIAWFSDVPSLEQGGIVQVVPVGPTVDTRPSANPPSEAPKGTKAPAKEAVPEVELKETSPPKGPEPKPQPKPEPKPEPRPEPQEQPVPAVTEAVTEKAAPESKPATSDVRAEEILTSEKGEEVVTAGTPEPRPAEKPPAEPAAGAAEAQEDRGTPAESQTPAPATGSEGATGPAVSASSREGQPSGSETAEVVPPPSGKTMLKAGGAVGYPKGAQDRGEGGTVKLRVLVNARGKLEEVRLVESSGNQELDRQAMRWAESSTQWVQYETAYEIPIVIVFDGINGIPQFGQIVPVYNTGTETQ